MAITQPRLALEPFEYPAAADYWLRQQQAHWLHTEVSMQGDLQDWELKMTPAGRELVGRVLKGFAQTEVLVNEYWSRYVAQWFPKPEVALMASAFGGMEGVHARAYAYLNESLGLVDFDAFLSDPVISARLGVLQAAGRDAPLRDVARSLAVFSGFAEGVQLFSQFAVLMSFSRSPYNMMKGVAQIVAFSVKDESLHSEAGCWLFRTLVAEHPEIWTKELKRDIYDAARAAVALEDDFIDSAFALGPVDGIDKDDLKAFVRFRANAKLKDLGLASNWRNLDMEAVARLDWFDYLTAGVEHQDFFAGRVTGYGRGTVDWDRMYDDD